MSKKIDEMIDEGVYMSYADAIRHALDLIIKQSAKK
jgi:Arc/MetJ-type ribon-helix-helix transcriptional regulator